MKKKVKVMDASEMAKKKWAALTKEQKSELGRRAANARWAKAKKRKPN